MPEREVVSPAQRIYDVIRQIPPGRVATYGQIAALAGLPGHARQVGQALRDTPDGLDLPWQRVINAKGEVSPRSSFHQTGLEAGMQRHLLQEEGVAFDSHGRIDLDRFGWDPDARPRRKGQGGSRERRKAG
jgi:methylated-DNA-protein-cysteine methyltransferase-like protein